MSPSVLLKALLAALPAAALAQDKEAPSAPHRPACSARAEARGALGALPARAGTVAEPQRGSVAPSTRVPTHTDTPSSRAMAAASARAEKTTDEEKKPSEPCKTAIAPYARENGGAQATEG